MTGAAAVACHFMHPPAIVQGHHETFSSQANSAVCFHSLDLSVLVTFTLDLTEVFEF